MQEQTELMKKLVSKDEKQSKIERKIIFKNVFDDVKI